LSRAAQNAVALTQRKRKEHLDSRWPDQVPGPGAAQIRPGSGCGGRFWRILRTACRARSSSRCYAWKRLRRWVFRAACCASTGAASISGTGECGSPLERSWRWEDACSPQARADGAPRLTRADAARVTIMLRSS